MRWVCDVFIKGCYIHLEARKKHTYSSETFLGKRITENRTSFNYIILNFHEILLLIKGDIGLEVGCF